MQPVMNERGERLLSVIEIDERDIHSYAPVTFALVIARAASGFLLVSNSMRKVWELPGGRIDPGESARQCAARELEEESCQTVESLRWRALLKMEVPPHHPEPDPPIYYGALYCGELHWCAPFVRNEETDEIGLWRPDALPSEVSAIDAYLLQLFR